MAKQNLSSGVKTLLILAAKGDCYNPSCTESLIVERDGTPIVNFEIAHIRDELSNNDPDAEIGWRYWPDDLTQEQRNRFENLILLCKTCHKLVDKIHPREFSIDLLHEWKAENEGEGSTELAASLNGLTVDQLEATLVNAIESSDSAERLRQMSGGNSTLHLRFLADSIAITCNGDHPLRELQLTITDESKRQRKIKFMEETQGNGMSAPQAINFLEGAIVYRQFFSVFDFRAKSATSFLNIALPNLSVASSQHFSYRATTLNGVFNGAIYLFHRDDGKILHAQFGFANDRLIHEFPEQYPKIGDSQDPHWDAFP